MVKKILDRKKKKKKTYRICKGDIRISNMIINYAYLN